MNIKIILKYVFPVLFLLGIVGSSYYFLLNPLLARLDQENVVKNVAVGIDTSFGWKFPVAKFPLTGPGDKEIAYSDIRDPGGIPQGLPVRLQIPIIGVDSTIEDAQITNDGRMDVPAGSVNVAWFSLGPHPGQVGSAVIGGHFGIDNGKKFVFYDLDKLKVGDKVYIIDDKGDTLAFVVRDIKLFDRNADATTVFTSSDGRAHLNLITCEGVWNRVNDTYPERRVVFTDAIPSEGSVTVNTKLPVTAITPKIITPEPTKRIPTPTSMPSPTTIPTPTITSVNNPPTLAPMLIASAKSLYTTPLDGLITSLLLIAIGFLSFKLIRR